ncbi:hypothetical protein O3P69_013670 [Scylla paramamosain]|uniref:Uncharacterized protein n=1 Tax=Scylla paramamosain TaxID=85552 RepID=A0AAW0SSL2_SCYPA
MVVVAVVVVVVMQPGSTLTKIRGTTLHEEAGLWRLTQADSLCRCQNLCLVMTNCTAVSVQVVLDEETRIKRTSSPATRLDCLFTSHDTPQNHLVPSSSGAVIVMLYEEALTSTTKGTLTTTQHTELTRTPLYNDSTTVNSSPTETLLLTSPATTNLKSTNGATQSSLVPDTTTQLSITTPPESITTLSYHAAVPQPRTLTA